MKHRKASWSIKGGEYLAKILTAKVSQTLYEKITNISEIILPEKYTKEAIEILKAAKAPKKEGKGYQYPRAGGIPFMETFVTNGRSAIKNMVRERDLSNISYI